MRVFITHSFQDRELVAHLVALLRDDGHEVFDATAIAAGGNWLSEMSSAIRSADVVVAVVTGDSPHLSYQLGLAAGVIVPILIAARVGERLPVDLSSVPYVQLTGDIQGDARTIARRANELKRLSVTRRSTLKSAETALWAAIQRPAALESLSPDDFERLVVELFRDRGYAVTNTRSTRERGVDFTIESREDGGLVLVEAKKLSRQSRVSVETVRRLLSAVSAVGASLGVLVATSDYTAAAVALAAETNILLCSLEQLLAARPGQNLLEMKQQSGARTSNAATVRTLVYGSGITGVTRIRNILRREERNRDIVGLIDDDPKKLGCSVLGVRIVGGFDTMLNLVRAGAIDEVIIATRTLPIQRSEALRAVCRAEQVRLLASDANRKLLLEVA